jgi:hypothetical protein
MIEQAPIVLNLPVFGIFLLANAIIIGICGPKLMQEIRAGMFRAKH